MTLPQPNEEVEQANFVQWLEIKGYKYTAVPNSTYTKSWMQKRKNQRMGLRPGFPDLIVIAKGRMLCIEMKRLDGGTVSKYQKGWIEALRAAGMACEVCAGAEKAIAFVYSIVGK